MKDTLYIVGNGFDVFHNIHSTYKNYAQWLSTTHCDILNEIDETFGVCNSCWWNNFESNLASVDVVEMSVQIGTENEPDFLAEHFRDSWWYDGEYAIKNRLDGIYRRITSSFEEWVNQLDLSCCVPSLNLKKEAIYLNFNYTDTLESVYGINHENVCHIHGRASVGDSLILGHGDSYSDIVMKYSEPKGEGMEYYHSRTYKGAVNAVARKKKDICNIIADHHDFFDSLKDVKTIITLGFSYSKIDMGYIERICQSVELSKVLWIASAFSEDDKSREQNVFEIEGINNNIIIRKLQELDKMEY